MTLTDITVPSMSDCVIAYADAMARWQPGARERLQAVTLELFAEQGFEGTTVAEIASRAGLTERTFFRYFTDKREVLFTGQEAFEGMFVDQIAAAPPHRQPFAVVTRALQAVAADFFPPERQTFSRQRQTIIDGHPGLRERELLKLAGLTSAMAAALRERGTPEPTALLVAECGMTIFRVAFARWVGGNEDHDLASIMDEVVAELRELVARTTS
jgi:AcrR family transcriptional regulator